MAITYHAWCLTVNIGADTTVVTHPGRVKDRNFARPLQAIPGHAVLAFPLAFLGRRAKVGMGEGKDCQTWVPKTA